LRYLTISLVCVWLRETKRKREKKVVENDFSLVLFFILNFRLLVCLKVIFTKLTHNFGFMHYNFEENRQFLITLAIKKTIMIRIFDVLENPDKKEYDYQFYESFSLI